jgi:signal transduction histidine kinase
MFHLLAPPGATAVHARITPAVFLRRFALLLLFNSAIAVVLAWPTGKPLGEPMAYAQAIGLSIWLFIDFGRLLLRPDPRTGWPHGRRGGMLVVASIVAGYALGTTVGDAFTGRNTWALWTADPQRLAGYVSVGLLFGALGSLFFYAQGRLEFHRAQQAALERDAMLARLALLQSQLEPHMLFNTLANLRALIELDPPRAQAMLDRLIAFLRATLSASRAQAAHPLSSEFERLADYLALMGMRMGERLSVRLELPAELRALPVPPLLLQPLVENAIRHGLEPKLGHGRLDVAARREGDALWLTVRDTGVGLAHASPATAGTGFGLQQVRERLHTLFGARAALQVESAHDDAGGTLAQIRLPWPAEAAPQDQGRTSHG